MLINCREDEKFPADGGRMPLSGLSPTSKAVKYRQFVKDLIKLNSRDGIHLLNCSHKNATI